MADPWGGDFKYDSFLVALARYLPLSGRQVLALKGVGEYVDGAPPFYHLIRLGGEMGLRGYESSRYRDGCRLLLQGEYRLPPLVGPVGLALFSGLGIMGSDPGDLRLEMSHYTVGAGLRFQVDPESEMNLRLDFAWGDDGPAFYLTLGEVF